MKPAPFGFQRAAQVDDAVRALVAGEGAAKLTAGGQSLGPMLNLRLARPALLIDVSRIDSLGRLEEDADGVRIGAAVTHARIEDWRAPSPLARLLADVARAIAYRAVRTRGTVGGSLAHADPAADWPLVMATLGASLRLVGPRGERMVAADRFASAAYATDLAPDEVLVEVRVPPLAADARWAYRKFCRKPGEFALAQAACLFEPSRGRARVFLGAPAAAPTELPALAQRIAGGSAAERALDRLAAEVDRVLPGVAADRRQIAAVMLQRALEEVYA